MTSTSVGDRRETHVLVFEKGDEAMEGLQRFAREHDLTAAHFTQSPAHLARKADRETGLPLIALE